LEETNRPYAIAKIAGITMCEAYAKQYGFNAFAVMPSNVYGVGDNFHPEHSHVVAGLMRRFHEAKLSGQPKVVVWGTGSPLRELIDADDLADACVFLLRNYHAGGMINVGSGQEISIRDLALLMKSVVGYDGEVQFDSTRPDGTPRKIMDNSKLRTLGWRPTLTIEAGLKKMYAWLVESLATTAEEGQIREEENRNASLASAQQCAEEQAIADVRSRYCSDCPHWSPTALNVGCAVIGEGATIAALNIFRSLRLLKMGDGATMGSLNTISAHPAYQALHPDVGSLIMGDGAIITSRHNVDCSGIIRIGDMSGIAGQRQRF